MGAVTKGIPKEHVALLRTLGGYAGLVETGTYLGETAHWAANVFPQVHTVEASPDLHARAKVSLEAKRNVVQHLGRSADVLRGIVPTLHEPWLFWLDAHWSGAGTFGETAECPLLAELEIVLRSGAHAILIDDARLFFRPVGPPHDWRQWPTIDEICATIRDHAAGVVSMTIVDDVIFVLGRDVHEKWCEHLHAAAGVRRPFLSAWLRRRRSR
jgi:hypothetical protein